MTSDDLPPILADKHHATPSAFTPESLLREARRQKGAALEPVPEICLLDPDGDIVGRLKREGRARRRAAHRRDRIALTWTMEPSHSRSRC